MGSEETSPALLPRPSLPPKPQVPPKPHPRGTRWRRATDIILRKVTGEEGDPSRVGLRARHKSLPSLPNGQSPCLSVAKDGNPFTQPAGQMRVSLRVKPFPVPKLRLQETRPQQDNQPQAADGTERRVSSTKTPDSSDSEGRLCGEGSGSEVDSPFSEAQPGCASSCPCSRHGSSALQDGDGQPAMELCPTTLPSSPPALSLLSANLENGSHLDYWHITCHRAPGQPRCSPPNIPPPARPLPKEPDLIFPLQDKKEEPDVGEGVYMEVITSASEVDDHCTPRVLSRGNSGPPVSPADGFRSTEHPAYSKVHKPLPPVPAKPPPLLKTQSTNKLAAHVGAEGRERRRRCEGALRDVVAELREKFPSDGEETKSKKEKHTKNIENRRKLSLLSKWSPTNVMVPSLSQKRTSPLAELFSLQSKESSQEDEEVTISNQSPAALESPVKEPMGDVMAKGLENPQGDASELSCPATSPGVQMCLEQEDSTVPLLPKDVQDTRSPPHSAIRSMSSRGRQKSLKSFWQERSIVQESGLLTQLSKQQLLLQESMYEVVTTERSYLESLGVAVNLFMESPALNLALAPRDRKSLFSSIGRIKEISQNFLDAMSAELDGNLFCDVCEVIRCHASRHFTAYVDYIRNMPYQEQTLHNLGKENPQIEEILRQLQEDPRCHRLPLKSFLVLPFQRITRLKILIETILKRTGPGSEDQASAGRALREVSKVVAACNHEVGRMKQMEELVLIANKTEFECKALPLVSSSRWLVRQGELAQLTEKENIFGQRKVSPVYLFLFNDLLLVAIKKGLDRFVVQDHVHRSLIEIGDGVEEEEVECELEKTFLLALLKNHRGTTSQRLLRASSQAERASWVEALRPRKSGKDEVYEEWDCPQVQCTMAYSTQQPGELSLLLGDVLNVIQKTTDGFLEGRRLADGERGWFPNSCVKEITNEHVQRRHLRQRYHVLQTANRMLSRRCISRERHTSTCFR